MAAQKGRLFLLSIEQTGSPGSYEEIAAARSNSMSLNNEQVDITTKGSNGWREYLEGAGIQSMALSVSGVFKDSASEELLRAAAFANTISNFQLEFGNGDAVTGAFAVASYERAGEHNGEETFTCSLESAGAITFTPAT